MANPMKPYPIGIPGAPYPTMICTEDTVNNRQEMKFTLGVREEDDPDQQLILHSSRTYEEVMGMLYRDMPVPSMLPAFEKLVHHSDPNHSNHVANILSDPGTGKSFLAKLLQKARDSRKPLVTDAGGKNLEYLLFETVFDAEEMLPLTQAFDEALLNGRLTKLSIQIMRDALGDHYPNNGNPMVDWDAVHADKKINPQILVRSLQGVAKEQRWDTSKLGIGFRIKVGPLVEAWRDGRDITIDELNKCKPGSETPLQIVWQVLNGETEEHTVNLGGSGTFTFKRGEGGLVVCTGNLPKDGSATHLISESFDSRVPAFEVPNFDERDWAHRICQQLTGLPITTLHLMMKGKFDSQGNWEIADRKAFTELLFKLRGLGLSSEESRNIPDHQRSLIENWPSVIVAANKLAKFYAEWSNLVDPESKALQAASMAPLLMEIEDPNHPTAKITPRTMLRHVNAALQPMPGSKEQAKTEGFSPSFNFKDTIELDVSARNPAETTLGTHLVQIIMEEIYRTSQQAGKPNLYAMLRQKAAELGLTRTQPDKEPELAELLNVDASTIAGSKAQATKMQSTLVKFLRTRDPMLTKRGAQDEDIVPLSMVEDALAKLVNDRPAIDISEYTTRLFVPNTDGNSYRNIPLVEVAATSRDMTEDVHEVKNRLLADTLLTDTELFTALALPLSGPMALDAMWNRVLSIGVKPGDESESLLVAENRSSSGLAVTTALCKRDHVADSEYMKLHILRNSKKKKTLIVGKGHVSEDLKKELKHNGITYIDREDRGAEGAVKKAINGIVDSAHIPRVIQAFALRNQLRVEQDAYGKDIPIDNFSLEQLLTDANLTGSALPVFVTSLRSTAIPSVQAGRSI